MLEGLSELLSRLIALASEAIERPRFWFAAGLVGFASISLPFLRGMYSARQQEETRRQIADQVASGQISEEVALALLGVAKPVRLSAEAAHTWGWILGPLGLVGLIGGIGLGRFVHALFYMAAAAGVILLALSLSFRVIADAKRKVEDTASIEDMS
jgi:hypothetical protein